MAIEEGLGSFWYNLGLKLIAYSLTLFIDRHEARELIYLISVSFDMFTTLKRLAMVSSTDITIQLYLFLGSLACLVETASYSMLKSYWLTLDIVYGARNREYMPSATNFISFTLKK